MTAIAAFRRGFLLAFGIALSVASVSATDPCRIDGPPITAEIDARIAAITGIDVAREDAMCDRFCGRTSTAVLAEFEALRVKFPSVLSLAPDGRDRDGNRYFAVYFDMRFTTERGAEAGVRTHFLFFLADERVVRVIRNCQFGD
jgi:hypothetical protein